MKELLVVLAVLCGIVLIAEINTGKVEPMAVAGIGIICAALAHFADRYTSRRSKED